jgi:2,4-dienoyl-CoA reductase-like NADH-dependent reductase (Old Yellow Enzyme family)
VIERTGNTHNIGSHFIASQAAGYANVPGIWNAAQIAEWKTVCVSPRRKTAVFAD